MASTAGPCWWRVRSRIWERKVLQLSELTSPSKPEAYNAHMVANMVSLPSTVALVTGAACIRGRWGTVCGKAAADRDTTRASRKTQRLATILEIIQLCAERR